MSTQLMTVPLGTTSPAFQIGPTQSICAGPAVLGGTVLFERAATSDGPWRPWAYGTISQGGSFRPGRYEWGRVTAATQNATVVVSDLGPRTPLVIPGPLATASATAEQVMYSLRIAPGYLPANFNMTVQGSVTTTNAAHTKSIAVYVNGVGGTSIFTSEDLTGTLNYNFIARCTGINGVIHGYGLGLSGGIGVSATAYTSLVYDYLNNELEVVVAGTKATAAETLQVESLVITIN